MSAKGSLLVWSVVGGWSEPAVQGVCSLLDPSVASVGRQVPGVRVVAAGACRTWLCNCVYGSSVREEAASVAVPRRPQLYLTQRRTGCYRLADRLLRCCVLRPAP